MEDRGTGMGRNKIQSRARRLGSRSALVLILMHLLRETPGPDRQRRGRGCNSGKGPADLSQHLRHALLLSRADVGERAPGLEGFSNRLCGAAFDKLRLLSRFGRHPGGVSFAAGSSIMAEPAFQNSRSLR